MTTQSATRASTSGDDLSAEILLETLSLSKIYPNGRGIRNISFSVHRGEVFGLLGPNGAGKTTTIRTLLDFIRPTGGSATLLGVDAQSTPLARVPVGFLPGDLELMERASGRDWLRFQADLRPGVDWAYAEHLMAEVEADADEPLRNLSSGNRQKFGIVNALMHKPELVVLDEPASGLDPLIRRRVYGLLSEVRARGGGVLLSSHVLPEVERICDRVGIIRRGELVAVETLAALKARAIKRIDIEFRSDAPVDVIKKLPGVIKVEVYNSIAHIAVSGDLSELVKAVAPYEVVDITTGAQGLEEKFMSFYDGHDDEESAGVAT